MAKKTMTAEERKAMMAAFEDIRKECGRVMKEAELPEVNYTRQDLEDLDTCDEFGY